MRKLGPADYRRVPWANGLGLTSEIARRDGEDGAIDWRVSIADVGADGPFSSFPGYDRVIVTIEGAGMILRHGGGRAVRLAPLEPYSFDGGVDTICELVDGPIRDFNLITRRGAVAGDLEIVRLEGRTRTERGLPAHTVLLYCVAGTCRVGAASGRGLAVGPGEAALGWARHLLGDHEPAIAIAVTIGRPGARDRQPARATAAKTRKRAR